MGSGKNSPFVKGVDAVRQTGVFLRCPLGRGFLQKRCCKATGEWVRGTQIKPKNNPEKTWIKPRNIPVKNPD